MLKTKFATVFVFPKTSKVNPATLLWQEKYQLINLRQN